MERHEALSKLQSEIPHELVLALAALGKVGTVADLQHIIPLISKSSFEIRHIAAGVASSIIRLSLLEKYEEQSEPVRAKLGRLLSRLAPDLIQELGRDIAGTNEHKQINAVRLLKHLESTPAVKTMLTTLLSNRNNKIRETAIGVIGKFAEENDNELLLKWINDPDPRMRSNAIEVIEQLGDTSLVYILYQLKNDPNNRIRANVLKALHTLMQENITKELIEMLESEQPRMQASALWVISQMDSVTNYKLYLHTRRLLKHTDVSVVDNAVKALRKIDLCEAKRCLIDAGYAA